MGICQQTVEINIMTPLTFSTCAGDVLREAAQAQVERKDAV